MDFTELLIEISSADVERASSIASMVVPYGFYIEDYSDLIEAGLEIAHSDIFDEELLLKDRTKAFIHIYLMKEINCSEAISFLEERFTASQIGYNILSGTVKEEDWANNWKKYFLPTNIGERLLILPSWEERPVTDRTVLEIDPGAAFGTGTHESTKLCLEAAQRLVKADDNVLDLGCGSGILTIAAVLLGAKSVIGVDIDPVAIKVTLENAEKNKISDRITLLQGNILDDKGLEEQIGYKKYDLIFANIVADVIIALSSLIKKQICKNGVLITSGIIDTRKDEVINALTAEGFSILEINEENGWVSLVCKG